MDISAAALPPRQPYVSEKERMHPKYPEYRNHVSAMTRLLVEAPSFADWLAQSTYHAKLDTEAKHPRYPEFLAWMRATRGGARKCPAGNAFPANFHYWLNGGRW